MTSLHFTVFYLIEFTSLHFTSLHSLHIIIEGALVVTLRQGRLKGKEEELLERVLTGGDPDPYVIISVLEDESSPAPENIATRIFKKLSGSYTEPPTKKLKKSNFARVLDSGISVTKVCAWIATVYPSSVISNFIFFLKRIDMVFIKTEIVPLTAY